MGEVMFVVSLIAFLILPFALLWKKHRVGSIFWMLTMSVIGLVVVSAEITGKITNDLTISRMFWQWSLENPTQAWIVLGLLLIGWLSLLLHLAWKMIFKKKAQDEQNN